MLEAQKGSAGLSDVDEGTFVRFSQWAYTGRYEPADLNFVNVATSEAPATAGSKLAKPPKAMEEDYGEDEEDKNDADDYEVHLAYTLPRVQSSKNNKKAKKPYNWVPGRYGSKDTLKDDFVQLKYALPKTIRKSTRPKTNESTEDYSEVFLSHARVYVSQKNMI